MNALVLDSLEIRGFRAFGHLRIDQLARVNLIVGRNNVGKTCLLEALRLYAERGSPALLWEMLELRDEGNRPRPWARPDSEQSLQAIRHLFHGREHLWGNSIHVGAISAMENTLILRVDLYKVIEGTEGERSFHKADLKEAPPLESLVPMAVVQFGAGAETRYRLEADSRRPLARPPEVRPIRNLFIPANGLDRATIGRLWDNTALTEREEEVLAALCLIAPAVERVNLIGEEDRRRGRCPMVKAKGIEDPVPLGSLGEGMNRLFGIALALVNAEDGLLLIDEFESGLHYSVQPELWKLIFLVAERLNVQVVATTHSWDCIEAFQKATQQYGGGSEGRAEFDQLLQEADAMVNAAQAHLVDGTDYYSWFERSRVTLSDVFGEGSDFRWTFDDLKTRHPSLSTNLVKEQKGVLLAARTRTAGTPSREPESPKVEGLLIRLGMKEAEVVATLFDRRRLAVATREQIEVR